MSSIVIRDGEAFADPDPEYADVLSALDDSASEAQVDPRRAENERLMALADRLPDPVTGAVAGEPSPPPAAGEQVTVEKAYGRRTLDAALDKGQPLVRVRLFWPLTLDGQRLKWVSLWPPEHDDVEAVAKGRLSIADMVTRMAGLPDGVLGRLRVDDSDRIVSIALFLAPEGLQP